ncbi:MFS transporter [Pigmentiphaga litoralis]|uniref:Bug family tripartite tricarboxylate transporter substrate binding protein n=1 Tax=Pigmentiphaga litoralis TaxID=516702 RepID=UPI0016741FDB|nr:tripartite tricarboxylate transporter substrate binding protein [Pigmentiphaga litoralis]GGX21523.1 MFS transporter [Pigmentiphaga litoralis]
MSLTSSFRPVLQGAAIVLSLGAATALHAAYPDKPVKLIVTFVPGGGADLLARYLAKELSASLKQPVVVENKPGAGGLIGIDAGLAAAPDGYTLTLISSSYTVNPSLYKLKFDPVTGITPIVQASSGPLLIVTPPNFPARTVPELIALAKSKPGDINYASSGLGSIIHLATERFDSMAGIRMTHIPYKGGGNAQTDLMAGQVDVYFAATASALPHVASGKMRAVAVTTPKRIAALPQVPTVAESGLPGYDATLWYGLIGPKGMPQDIVDRLNKEVNVILKTDGAKEKLLADGAEPAGGTPAQFRDTIQKEIGVWGAIVKKLDIKPE